MVGASSTKLTSSRTHALSSFTQQCSQPLPQPLPTAKKTNNLGLGCIWTVCYGRIFWGPYLQYNTVFFLIRTVLGNTGDYPYSASRLRNKQRKKTTFYFLILRKRCPVSTVRYMYVHGSTGMQQALWPSHSLQRGCMHEHY